MLSKEVASNLGTQTMLDNTLIEALQERFQGEIIRPSDTGDDDAIDSHPVIPCGVHSIASIIPSQGLSIHSPPP